MSSIVATLVKAYQSWKAMMDVGRDSREGLPLFFTVDCWVVVGNGSLKTTYSVHTCIDMEHISSKGKRG